MIKKEYSRYISISLCTLLFTNILNANENNKSELQSITIVDKASSAYNLDSNPSISRNGISLEHTAKSVQTFTNDFIEDYQAQGIENIITMSSNTVYTGDNHGRSNEISMRGFSDVPILIDGLKVTNKMAHPDIFNFKAIEIQKGPDSLQYGESSPGGIVNLTKKKPSKESSTQVQLELSDNTSYTPKLDMTGSLNDDKSLYYRFISVFEHDEGHTNSNTDAKKIFLAPSIAYDINDNHKLTFIAEYTDETTPSSFGTYIDSNGNLVAPIENTISNPDEEFKKTQKIVGFDLDSTFNTWNSNFKYRYIDYVGDNADVHMPLAYSESTGTVTRAYAYQKQEFEEHTSQYTLNKETELLGLKNAISVGIDYNKAYSKTSTLLDRSTLYTINLSNPTYEALTTLGDHPSATDYSSDKTFVKSWGTFIQDNIYLSNDLILNTGLRYSESKPQNSQKTKALSPSLGLVKQISDKTTLYTNYSESFTPNTNKDDNGDILDPETGKGIEFGIKQKLFEDRFNLTTALFKIEKENIAQLDPNDATNTIYLASGKQQSQGLEIDLMGDISSNLSLIASYGYTKTKDKDNRNNELINIPNHTANIFTKYNLSNFSLSNFDIGGGARYIGSKYANTTNSIKLDSTIIYNASIAYKKDQWKANLSIQNLTDKEYVDGVFSGTRVYAGTPRTIIATIGYKF